MKELPQDRPYRFRPPTPRRWLTPLLCWLNRAWYLGHVYRIRGIDCEGIESVVAAVEAGDAVLLAPNHADHADVHVMMEVLTRVGVSPRFMGAREIFEVHPLASFALQSAGVFSVDRDGADIAAVKMALGILEEGRHPLVIYPEGEIYHHHEWLDPLHDGLASILLRVAKRLPQGRSAWVIPVAFRFICDPEVEATFAPRMAVIEKHLGWKPREDLPVVERLTRLGAGALALKETEFFGDATGGTIPERIAALRDRLLLDVEGRHGLEDKKAPTVPERVRALRYRIRKVLLDEENPPSEELRRRLMDDIDRVHVAYQAYSYRSGYLEERPTLSRISETLTKLEEDLLGRATYPAARRASVVFGESIDATALLRSGELPEKGGAMLLTGLLEKQLVDMMQAGLQTKDGGSIVTPDA
jgi:hypothetical protein